MQVLTCQDTITNRKGRRKSQRWASQGLLLGPEERSMGFTQFGGRRYAELSTAFLFPLYEVNPDRCKETLRRAKYKQKVNQYLKVFTLKDMNPSGGKEREKLSKRSEL